MCADPTRPTSAGKAWLALFRIPNLFTVPGDPLAGVMLAAAALDLVPAGTALFSTLGAALALYSSGLLANDYCDRAVDVRERPQRPIPSGAVPAKAVLMLAIILTAAGLLLAARAGQTTLLVALTLSITSWFYNAVGKRMAWLAPINMGVCRGLNLLMGAAILGLPGVMSKPVLIAAVLMTAYIALITAAARHEADENGPGIPAWIPRVMPFTLTAGLLAIIQPRGLALGLALMAVIWSSFLSYQLLRSSSPSMTQKTIGWLIRGLILVQATLCASAGPAGQSMAILLLILFPVSGWFSKWFHGS